MIALALCGLFCGAFATCLALAYKNGKNDAKIASSDDKAGEITKAALVRDRLFHDAGFAKRVRDRFTR